MGRQRGLFRPSKKLSKKAEHLHIALLMYRATLLANGKSPVEILMGRKVRNKVPALPSTLNPQSPDLTTLKQKRYRAKEKQRENYINATRPKSADL